ncbi:hypothetical protein, partial [Roseovarius sp. SYSU LYC5161]|uniref:hypothetical protein n=1 Tax=Roseovarius halophilus (ex Wu et al. 2025) TaxID=3376060 RepID=UPI00399A6FF6
MRFDSHAPTAPTLPQKRSRTAVITTLLYFISTLAVDALSTSTFSRETTRLGECTVVKEIQKTKFFDERDRIANVKILAGPIISNEFDPFYPRYAGGSYFAFGGERVEKYPKEDYNGENPDRITEYVIATCLEIAEEKIIYVDQDGADEGGTYENETLMGFGFILSEPAGGYSANTFHTFTIGSGSLPTPPDVIAPTVGLSSNATDPHSGAFTVTATFDEDVTGFEV